MYAYRSAMNWTPVLVAIIACSAPHPVVANRAKAPTDAIPPWPIAIDLGLDSSCQPSSLLQRTFPGWSGERCGVITPSSSADETAATWECLDDDRRAAQPFVYYRIEKLRADGGFGTGYIGVPHAGAIDVYRIDYMADPCNDSGGCPARGGTEIVTCKKFFPVCDQLGCFECDDQHVVATCSAGTASERSTNGSADGA